LTGRSVSIDGLFSIWSFDSIVFSREASRTASNAKGEMSTFRPGSHVPVSTTRYRTVHDADVTVGRLDRDALELASRAEHHALPFIASFTPLAWGATQMPASCVARNGGKNTTSPTRPAEGQKFLRTSPRIPTV